MRLTGLHHITAMASDPARNVAFYTRVLGLRLVKKTVNFDDPGTYHLYYGDDVGSPGTILTFFPWPQAQRGQPGIGQVTAFAFHAPPDSLSFWQRRLRDHGGRDCEIVERFGRSVLGFEDHDGFRIELVEAQDNAHLPPVQSVQASEIPPDCELRGLHGATLSLEGQETTGHVLTQLMGATRGDTERNRFRYQLGAGHDTAWIDLLCLPAGRWGTGGTGIIHHIAWRTPDENSQREARRELVQAGFNVSPVMDRTYFHSIYYREPGGVLFEIATDPPGFTVDESPENLGRNLMLPGWLKHQREMLETILPPLA